MELGHLGYLTKAYAFYRKTSIVMALNETGVSKNDGQEIHQ